jgi:hypothetical protein
MLYFWCSDFYSDLFGEPAGATPVLILRQELGVSKATKETIERKPREFCDRFLCKKIAGHWRPLRIVLDHFQ